MEMSNEMNKSNLHKTKRNSGFTLLELMLVVAIVAITGIGATLIAVDTEKTVTDKLVPKELAELKKAILQFKKDTGFLPKCGPFSRNPAVGGKVFVEDGDEAWFDHPANFKQLFDEPLDENKEPVLPWNMHTGRGWRGPYLQKIDGWVTVGSGLDENGYGDPSYGSLIREVPAVADPYEKEPHESTAGDWLYVWCESFNHERTLPRGRPYYFLDWNNPKWARIVCCGPNGNYESEGFAVHPEPLSLNEEIGDDVVLFLNR